MKQPRSEKSAFFQAWDQERWIQIAFFAVVVSIGVASRFWLVDWPNVKPVAALVLFSAFPKIVDRTLKVERRHVQFVLNYISEVIKHVYCASLFITRLTIRQTASLVVAVVLS